jgi:hypothetical protein
MHFFETIDIFGYNLFFNFNGKLKRNSSFGGILTLLSMVSMIGAIIYYLLKLLDRTNPNLLYQMKKINHGGEFKEEDINFGFFPYFFKVRYLASGDGSYLPFNISNLEIKLQKKETSGNKNVLQEIKGSLCNDISFFPDWTQKLLLSSSLFNTSLDKTSLSHDTSKINFFCIDTVKSNISSFINSDQYDIFISITYRETNPEQIPKIKSNLTIPYLNIEHYNIYNEIDITNYDSPNDRGIQKTGVSDVYLGERFYETVNFQKVVIDTDFGWIMSKIYSIKSYFLGTPYSVVFKIDLDQRNVSFFQIQFTRDEMMIYYKRTYIKFLDFLAQVGGILRMVNIFFGVFSLPISQVLFRLDIINNIFTFEKNYFEDKSHPKSRNDKVEIRTTKGNKMENIQRSEEKKSTIRSDEGMISKRNLDYTIKVDKVDDIRSNQTSILNPEISDINNQSRVRKNLLFKSQNALPVIGKRVLTDNSSHKRRGSAFSSKSSNEITEKPVLHFLSNIKNKTRHLKFNSFLKKLLQSNPNYMLLSLNWMETFILAYVPFLVSSESSLGKKKLIYDKIWYNLSYQYCNIVEIFHNFIVLDKIQYLMGNSFLNKEKIVFKEHKYSILDYLY